MHFQCLGSFLLKLLISMTIFRFLLLSLSAIVSLMISFEIISLSNDLPIYATFFHYNCFFSYLF